MNNETGFSLVEMLLSATILLVISMAVFDALNRVQQAASYQAEVQAVIDNTRNALQYVERHLRQAGNDPQQRGFCAVSILGPAEVRIRSDITGSHNGKGDPDGDINDSWENLLIRYNGNKKRLEMVSRNGPAQIVAENISGFSLDFFDADGNPTARDELVRKITIKISGESTYKNPRSGKNFGIQLESTVRILT